MGKFNGLTDDEVREKIECYGKNIIKEKEPETFFDKFKEGFSDPMIKLLIFIAGILGVMSFMGYAEWTELIGIVISVFIVTLISAKTEVASDNEFRKLKDSAEKPKCKVKRNGKVVEILFEDVVVGDLVILQSGDKVPADGILVDGDLKVDNSALNGESEECKKEAVSEDFIYDAKAKITGDTFVDKHSLFRGATIFDGEGIMEIKKIGMDTMMGKMAEDMDCDEVESPLKTKLTVLAEQISKFGYIGATAIAFVLVIHQVILSGGITGYLDLGMAHIIKDVLEAIMLAVVIIVMAVPEGLPLMIAIVLMRNTSKMLQNNVLVRKAIGIETAGSLNILFSDKTGTITKGELEVVEFFDGDLKDSYKTSGKIKELMTLAIGKNTGSMFDDKGNVVGGNATDKALLKYLTEENLCKVKDIKIEKLQGFNSANKYSASQLDGKTVYKGAPERLLSKATKYINKNGEIVDIDKDRINEKIDGLAKRAMRVLAFAYSDSKLVENTLPEDLIIVGFVGIRDDVREEAKEAISEVQKAGIQVVMITGDRKETAVAIAKESGLIKSENDLAFTSEELNKMSDEEVKAVLKDIRVIARALPTDKSRMVRLSQEINLVCGMTGDGVNDSPALKRADVGFAMGSGTEVAKEAGEIVILDDNFNSIAKAILFGRTIYNNIIKFICFQLTINVTAVAISAIGPFIGVDHPLSITHILWINLIMDGLAALALGSEPALEKYMEEKPKSRTEKIVQRVTMERVLIMGTWLTALSIAFLKLPFFINMFSSQEAHMTAYFSLFVISAVFNGFNVRSEGLNIFSGLNENKEFIKVMGAIIVVQILLTFIGGDMFSCTQLTLNEWFIVIGLSALTIPVDLIRKIINKNIFK